MKSKIHFVVSLLFGLLFINSGLNKFFQYMPMPKDMPAKTMEFFQHFSAISWLMPLTGIAEIIGGLLIIFPRTRALGAVVIFPIMLGILATHIFIAPDGMVMALVLAAILAWIIYENWEKYLPMISKSVSGK